MKLPLMPKATAVWLIENTSLSFDQIAEFCGLHELEVQGIADGDVALGMQGYDPIDNNQLTKEEIIKELQSQPRSEETKQKMRGPKTEEHKAKLRGPRGEQANMRKPKSDEHKANMRGPKTEEHKVNMRKPRTEEHRENIRLAKLGKKRIPRTKEWKKNNSEAMKRSWARRKLLKQLSLPS